MKGTTIRDRLKEKAENATAKQLDRFAIFDLAKEREMKAPHVGVASIK